MYIAVRAVTSCDLASGHRAIRRPGTADPSFETVVLFFGESRNAVMIAGATPIRVEPVHGYDWRTE